MKYYLLLFILTSCGENFTSVEGFQKIPSFAIAKPYDPLGLPYCAGSPPREKLTLNAIKGEKSLREICPDWSFPRNIWAVSDTRILCYGNMHFIISEFKNGVWEVLKKVKGADCIDAGDDIYCFSRKNFQKNDNPSAGPFIFKSRGNFKEIEGWAFLGRRHQNCAVFGLISIPEIRFKHSTIPELNILPNTVTEKYYSLPSLLPGIRFFRIPSKIMVINNVTGKKAVLKKEDYSELLKSEEFPIGAKFPEM